jgi:hypothetical protein
MKSQPQRWTKQQQQESISRYQLATRLSEYGWVPESVSPDLGEDFIVNIYDSGIWSGLSFYIQEKSTQTLDQSAIRDERITYRVRVKDLLHWTPAALPVIFIVWDINQKTGYWINIADVIARLTEQKDNWHQQKTVQIQIPVSNQTDDTGLSQIRSIVANYSFPSVAKDKKLELNVTFRFPRTSAGDAIRDALERAIAIGDTVEISEKFVEKVEFSEWYTRLHGGIPSKGSIKIGPPKQKISLPTRLDVISSNGLSASIPYMDMQIIKSGTEETTFSNIHHDSPLHFTFIFNTRLQTLNLSVEVNSTNPGPNVKDTRDALLFLMALSKSGKLRLTNLSTQDSFEVHSPFDISAAHQNTEFYDLGSVCKL